MLTHCDSGAVKRAPAWFPVIALVYVCLNQCVYKDRAVSDISSCHCVCSFHVFSSQGRVYSSENVMGFTYPENDVFVVFFFCCCFFTCSALPVLLPSPVLLLLLLPPCPLKELNKTSKVFLFYLPYLLEVTQQRTMGDFSLCTLATDSFLTHTHADTEHTNTHISEKQHEVRKSGIKDFKTV